MQLLTTLRIEHEIYGSILVNRIIGIHRLDDQHLAPNSADYKLGQVIPFPILRQQYDMEKTIEQRLRLPGSIQKWSVTGLVLMASVFFCLSQAEAFFDATVFGGKTLNTTTETTFGGAFGLFLFFELEFSSLLYQEEVSTYNCNLKLPLGFPADDTFIGGYLTGGGGSFADHTMWNGGGGLWFSPRLVYHDPRVPLEIALRLDYRHLWIRGEENLHRVYIGLWFVPQNPLLTD